MTRKWTTLLLSLMLALMLPLGALAENLQHTLTIEPGDDLASIPAVADMLDVLAFTVTGGEKSGALTVNLSGTDLATIALGADTTGLYLHSDLVSNDVLYVTWDDGFALLNNVLLSAMAAEGEVDPAAAAAMEQSMKEAKTSIVTALQMETQAASAKTPEQELEALKAMFKDDPKMIEYFEGLQNRLVSEEGEFADEARDTAAVRQELVMNADDFVTICETNYMRNLMEQTVMASEPDLSEAELAEAVDALLEEVKDVYRESGVQVTVEAFLLDDAETLVGMTMGMSMDVKEESEDSNGSAMVSTTNVSMNLNYDRLTDPNGVSHKGDMAMIIAGETLVDGQLDLYQAADGVTGGFAALLADGVELTAQYEAANEGDVRNRALALYFREGATAIVEPAASDRPVIVFHVATAPANPEVLAKIDAADSASAVDVMKLSEEELQALANGVPNNAMRVVYSALALLPDSVLEMMQSEAE